MRNKRGWIFFSSLLLIFCVQVILSSPTGKSLNKNEGKQDSETFYLKNNIHVQQGPTDCKASYANWTDPGDGHFILPVNTAFRIGEFRGLEKTIKGSRGFLIIVMDENIPESRREIFFEFNSGNMGGIDSSEYIELIASSSQTSLGHLSQLDRKGISEGKVYEGMTKEGVRIALGYPARHRTPSLESDTWIYWRNRFRTLAVEFGQNGKVSLIRY
jgi:hypothetical protein